MVWLWLSGAVASSCSTTGSRKWEFNNSLPIDLSEKKSPVPQTLQKAVRLAKRVAPVSSLNLESAEENFILIFNHPHEWPLDVNYTELEKEDKHLV